MDGWVEDEAGTPEIKPGLSLELDHTGMIRSWEFSRPESDPGTPGDPGTVDGTDKEGLERGS